MDTGNFKKIFSFLQEESEMAQLTKSFDWSKTSLGHFDKWPQSLCTTVSNLLRSKFPMLLWWGEDLVQFYNDAYRPSLGNNGKHSAALGQKGMDCWPEIWERIYPMIQQVKQGGDAVWLENQLIPIYRNGALEDVYWTFSNSLVLDDNGEPGGVLATCVETTDSVTAFKKIEQSQQELLASFEESPVAIATISNDESLVFQSANPFYASLVGRRPEDIVGKPLLEALPELKGQGFDTWLKEVVASGKPFMSNEVAVELLRNGNMETIYVDLTYQPRIRNGKEVFGILVIATDVTQQFLARKKIEESEYALRNAIELAELGTWKISSGTGIILLSKRHADMFGLSEPFLKTEKAVSMVNEADHEKMLRAFEIAMMAESEGRYDVEYKITNPATGKTQIIRSLGQAYFDKDGKYRSLEGTSQDVTLQRLQQQELENKVVQRTKELADSNEKLQTINQALLRSNANLEEFTHAASHDLKEPIRKILFYINRLKDQLSGELKETNEKSFGRIENAAERMNELIDDLLVYSHVTQEQVQMESVDLNELVKEVTEDLELEIEIKSPVIEIGKLPVIKGYEYQLKQLFHNLITNAIKYSKKDIPPHIEITAANEIKNEIAYHVISVKDNGIGFEQEFKDKIFHMFSRLHSKSEYKGTGVGLSITKKVAENHHGFILAEGKPDAGSNFSIYLP